MKSRAQKVRELAKMSELRFHVLLTARPEPLAPEWPSPSMGNTASVGAGPGPQVWRESP